MPLARTTPSPPYYAVIFTSLLGPDVEGYREMADRMDALARQQPGFLGVDSARSEVGITVSYWRSLEDIDRWKANVAHLVAQDLGRKRWYQSFATRVARVERDSFFEAE
jgi:heme-degrading monooxygenase HmoA